MRFSSIGPAKLPDRASEPLPIIHRNALASARTAGLIYSQIARSLCWTFWPGKQSTYHLGRKDGLFMPLAETFALKAPRIARVRHDTPLPQTSNGRVVFALESRIAPSAWQDTNHSHFQRSSAR